METPTALHAAALVRSGGVSAAELVEQCLAGIDALDGPLNAWVHVAAMQARADAEAIDAVVAAGRADVLGPLAGVPFGVKDLEECAGMPTTRGSRWFADGPPADRDEIHVGRLRAAGAIAIGKTATPEFGAWAYTASPALGVTRNPWNPSLTPGGSSGGTAAAVSTGMVPFGTASDGGGSTRTPASFCGLVGLKPTYGRIPTRSVTWLAQNAVAGALTTTVADSALLLDVMAGPTMEDRTCLPPPGVSYLDASQSLDVGGLRAVWSADLGCCLVTPEVRALCELAAKRVIAAAGLAQVDVPVGFDDYILTYAQMEVVDRFVGIDPALWRERLDEVDPETKGGWEYCMAIEAPQSAAVETDRRAIVAQVATVFDQVDVILCPTSADAAFAAEGPMPTQVGGIDCHPGMHVLPAMLANLVNLPAISVPAGVTSSGMPVGLQIIAPRFREDICLAVAARYEAVHPWPRFAP